MKASPTGAAPASRTGLRLKAEDADDFAVVSACLQDALIPVVDMDFLGAERRFVLVANRFRWENCAETAEMPVAEQAPVLDIAFAPPNCRAYERIHCGVTFEGVTRVRRRGIDQEERGRILELLAIHRDGDAVVLEFASGAAVRLEGERIVCLLADLGEPWPTQWRPHHPEGEGA
jgi:hypothetical protein